MTLKRIAIGVSYDGSRYHGWQVQQELNTLQAEVERALSFVANHPIHTICAGRTDAGVHATAQVLHFDSEAIRSSHSWIFGPNSCLPADICVKWAAEVASDFNARFSATARTYRYIIYNHPIKPGILRNAVGWWHRALDVEKMHIAGQYLLGEHDFSSFRGAGCQSRSARRNVTRLQVSRRGDMVIVEVQANAFLLHMVRNIVGVLVTIGSGDQPPEWAGKVLQAKDRRQASITISPVGLYLVQVDYPAIFNLPLTSEGPFFLTS